MFAQLSLSWLSCYVRSVVVMLAKLPLRWVQPFSKTAFSRLEFNSSAVSAQMEGRAVDLHWVPYEVLEQFQRERRCMNCKKRTFRDMVTCEKCREFSYCSIECLEVNRVKHEPQCDVINCKKGTAHMLDRNLVMSVRQKAKSLDEEGNIAANEDAPDNLNENNEPSVSQRASDATKKRKPRKRRNRRRGKGKTTNVSEAEKSSSPAPEIASSIEGGKFGGKVTVDSKIRSGTAFGDGWWKPKIDKENGSAKVDETSGAFDKKRQNTRFPEYDTDTDDDGSGREISTDAVGTVPSEIPLDGGLLPEKPLDGSLLSEKRLDGSLLSEKPLDGSLLSERPLDGSLLSERPLDGSLLSERHLDGSLLSQKPKDSQGPNNNSRVKAGDNPGSTACDTADKLKARDQVGRVEDGSATSNTGTADEIEGRTAPNTGSQGGKVKDSEPVGSETGAANTEKKLTTTGVELVPYDKQKAREAEAAAGGRDPREPPKLEKCFFCRKESYTMLKCSRCKGGRYCNKSCQKEDFPKHKEFCKRSGTFVKAIQELPFGYLLAESMRPGGPRLSTRLRDLSHEFEYLFLGVTRPIFLMITGPYFHPFRHGVTVMDQEGVKTHIMFYNQFNMYFHRSDEMFGFGLPIPLARCLKPGNFILLRNSCWHTFFDGTFGIRIDDLQDVHFVFTD